MGPFRMLEKALKESIDPNNKFDNIIDAIENVRIQRILDYLEERKRREELRMLKKSRC